MGPIFLYFVFKSFGSLGLEVRVTVSVSVSIRV